jgi:hypothetical protein
MEEKSTKKQRTKNKESKQDIAESLLLDVNVLMKPG